jgi:nucleoside-diphosphate-sugar epimerase
MNIQGFFGYNSCIHGEMRMKVFIVGGTGFLGYYTVKELLSRGHQVKTMALPPLPKDNLLPPEVEITLGNYDELSDNDLLAMLTGCEGLIFAAGVDDRVVPRAPAYEFFRKGNMESTTRWIRLARQAGVSKAVVFNSYFAALDKKQPELKLVEKHPYVRSRREQIEAAKLEAGDIMRVSFLMLPYIFGSMPGRVPLWKPLIKYLTSWIPFVFYPAGGSAMVSVEEVAQAAVGALEQGEAGAEYEVASANLTWKQMIAKILAVVGKPKPVVTVPAFLVRFGAWLVKQYHHSKGLEGGLDLTQFVELQTSNAFLDLESSRNKLGYPGGDLDAAFRDTVLASTSQTPSVSVKR